MFQAYFDWAAQSAPWLNNIWPWLDLLKSSWHTIESVLLLGGLYWISRRLRRERIKMNDVVGNLGERMETFGQFAKAARDAAETAAVSATAHYLGLSNWEALRAEWIDIRDRIELAIERIDHKSVRRKYAKINRYSYRDIIVTLGQDEILTPKAEAALMQMNQKYLALRSRPGNTSPADVMQFRTWVRDVNGSLPRLPKAKTSETPQTPLSVAAE